MRGHLGEHLSAEQLRILGAGMAARDAPEQGFGRGRRQVGRARGRMAVVGRGGAERLEEGAPLAVRREIAVPGGDVLAG